MPLRDTDRIIKRLRSEGLKITPQRTAILGFLDGNKTHPSVDEIYREVLKTFPTLSLATVYNTLDTLERIREVTPLHVDSTRKRFDPDTRPHHHAVCRCCGTIHDLFGDAVPEVTAPGEVPGGFRVESASVAFQGVCGDCAAAGN